MGRQVNFYMAGEDEERFLDFVKSTGDVLILPYASPTERFKPLERLSDVPIPKFLGAYGIFNRTVSNNLRVSFLPKQGYYTIDFSQSSVIEFTKAGVSNRTLYPGRIWAESTILDRERMALLPKEPEFAKWYYVIANWIRRRYKHLEYLFYAGPAAQKLIEEGFVLK